MKKIVALAVLFVQVLCAESVLENLHQAHPRLLLNETAFKKLKTAATTDKILQRYLKDVLKKADDYVGIEPVSYKIPDGLRLLSVSREAIARIHTLSFAWRWTREDKYADQAIKEMLAICSFKDWNPRHFLDTAEMCNAVGLGYDWLYHYMDDKNREIVKAGLIKHGLTPNPGGQVRRINNWNMVCNSGLIVAASAIAETDPQYAEKVIPRAVKYMPNALKYYAPNGAWMEGPAYWHYATRYVAYGLDAMDSSLGTNFDLDKSPGLKESGLFPIHTAGATGEFFCFADAGFQDVNAPNRRQTRGSMACMFWLARKYNDTFISDAEHEILKHRPATVHHLIWYVAPTKNSANQPLDAYFKGAVPVITMRSAWNDKNANWVGVKAGFNQVPHGHLDLGGFEYESQGVRWALDLGSENYNVPGYWDKRVGGKRWSYWRVNSESHNVPMIDGKGQLEDGTAEIIGNLWRKGDALTKIDLTKAYSDRAKSVIRRVGLTNLRQELFTSDSYEFSDNKKHEIAWAMMTDSTIVDITSEKVVLSNRDNKFVTLEAKSGTAGKFTVEPVKPVTKPLKSRSGFKRIVYTVTTDKEKDYIRIIFKNKGENK